MSPCALGGMNNFYDIFFFLFFFKRSPHQTYKHRQATHYRQHTHSTVHNKKKNDKIFFVIFRLLLCPPPPIDRPSTATNNNEKVVPCYVGFETREQENRKKRRDNWFASFSFCRYLNAFEIHAPERNYGQRGKRRRRGGCSLLLWLLFCWHCLWFREHGWNIEKKKKGMLHFETLPTIV